MRKLFMILALIFCLQLFSCSSTNDRDYNNANIVYADRYIKIIRMDSTHYVFSGKFDPNHSSSPAVYDVSTNESVQIYLYDVRSK